MYHVKTTKRFNEEIKKFDRYTQVMLITWITNNLEATEDPRRHGKSLTGNLNGLWRYRIGDYYLICNILYDKLTILSVNVGHRREVYKN